ncbi:thymidine phosphorylase-like isoform X1 [Oncorhynchus clarkii lewisi]|uniref:thymidine phosphorylase-like isoform X1 n=1 Tax=Oncorhynchus clarkii lewisi TaxID=490388 RepID=UPI0039B976DB
MAHHEQSKATFPEHIRKKRNGEQLSAGEIRDFVQGVKDKTIQESQIGAMLMAIWLKGMVAEETLALTKEMMMSGEVMSWPAEWEGLMVDKHSTGGVGDKISLVLAPALAACGCKVPMISGRGLAHTGGTLDKLESIPGFNVYQSVQQLHRILEEVGCCIVGQTDNLVPADKVMYALRDVTSTVDSLPLITGSIISKKGAESLSALVLDVKFGNAALYKDLDSAKSLAQSMVTVGNSLGIRTGAVLSRMNCPIGRCVGNTLEVMESLECLKGRGPDDILELVTSLGGLLLWMIGRAGSLDEGKKVISTTLQNGAALEKFQNMMIGQGVANQIAASLCSTNADYYSILRRAHYQTELETQGHGTVLDIDGMVIAQVLHRLGAGRSKAGDPVNHSVGAELLVSLGQKVEKGQPWLRVHYETPALSAEQRLSLQGALTLGPVDQLHTQPLVAEIILP